MNKKLFIALGLVALFCALPAVAATAAASGPSNTILDMPVQYSFTGLTASTAYNVICTTGSNHTVISSATSDSSGALTVTIDYFYSTGSNHYVCEEAAAGTKTTNLQFNIDNMDIIPYFVVLITLTIILSVMKMFGGRKGGLF